jgi:anti-sigma-K factor RskA
VNCDQAEELIGAYAVDALPDDEAAEFRAHIATCADHATRAREMRAFAATLADTVDPIAPPPRLRDRVLTAVAAEPQLDAQGAQPSPAVRTRGAQPPPAVRTRGAQPPPAVDVADRGRILRWPFQRLSPMQAWGALAAAVIAGLLAWNIVLQTGGESDAERYAIANADAVAPLLAGDEPVGTVLYFEGDRKAAVIADRIPAIDDTQTYQMWAIADGAPTSIGLMSPDTAGRADAIVDFDTSQSDTFAITVEPAGGSEQPTSDPVFVATIDR